MANQFTVEAKVKYINELHLDGWGIAKLKEGRFPTAFNVVDLNLLYEEDILILRCSKEFQDAFNLKTPTIVLKSRF